MQNLTIRQKLISIGIFSIVMMLALMLFAMSSYNKLIDETSIIVSKKIEQVDKVRTAQVNFKIQVQEWKNILLRGHEPSGYDKYTKGFFEKEAQVIKTMNEVKDSTEEEKTKADIDKFLSDYKTLGEEYKKALELYGQGGGSKHFDADLAVKGKDREPTKELDEIVKDFMKHLNELVEQKKTDEGRLHMIVAFGFVAIALLTVLILSLIIRSILSPISSLTQLSKDLAQGEGDLTKRLAAKGSDEIALASGYINTFLQKISGSIDHSKQSAIQNASLATQLDATSRAIGQRVDEQAKLANETLKQIGEIQNALQYSATTSHEASEDVKSTAKEITTTSKQILAITDELQYTVSSQHELSSKIERLSGEADQVKGILATIGDIAEQTNLLALNAAIEAARAGEHGRGFAVVADEVRKLAERTQKSLVESNSTIAVIVQSINEAIEKMGESSEKISKIGENSTQIESSLRKSLSDIEKTVNIVESVSGEIGDCNKKTSLVAAKSAELSQLSDVNAKSVEEIVVAVMQLHKTTEQIKDKLDAFRT